MTELPGARWPRYYVLDADGRPLAVDDVLVWARWYESANRIVARDLIGDVRVSTVFLGLDHDWLDSGAPVLWETLIFGGPHDGEMWRYASREAAEAGHAATVAAEWEAAARPNVMAPTTETARYGSDNDPAGEAAAGPAATDGDGAAPSETREGVGTKVGTKPDTAGAPPAGGKQGKP